MVIEAILDDVMVQGANTYANTSSRSFSQADANKMQDILPDMNGLEP